VQIKDYGEARQLTLFEHGNVALQILTSDFNACPADLLSWLKSRWREENFLKYASGNYGIGKICDYLADIAENTKLTRNPARDNANAAVRDAQKTLGDANATSPPSSPTPPSLQRSRTTASPAWRRRSSAPVRQRPRRRSTQAGPRQAARQRHHPDAQNAVLRAGRRGLQMVLRLLAHNAEHWLSTHLNAYLRDDDDTAPSPARPSSAHGRHITYAPATITVTLERPGSRHVARALACSPTRSTPPRPACPGDTRPITYRIAPDRI